MQTGLAIMADLTTACNNDNHGSCRGWSSTRQPNGKNRARKCKCECHKFCKCAETLQNEFRFHHGQCVYCGGQIGPMHKKNPDGSFGEQGQQRAPVDVATKPMF